jgi:hypothetical protein
MDAADPPGPAVGFGLGKLHHVTSRAKRERIVLGAYDAGLRHFDLAAAYGDGLCEAEVGRILGSRRASVSLATKFGIPCRSLGGRNIPLYFAGKALRKAFSPSYGREYGLRDFSPEAAVRGLEQSLRFLRTDYLDCLFLHEPRDERDFDAARGAIETLERMKDSGKILRYGISARTEQFLELGSDGIFGGVVQFELSSESPALVAMVPPERQTAAFGLIRFLAASGSSQRLDYAQTLRWFFQNYPRTMPIFASNRPEEIARLGRALAALPAPAATRMQPHASPPPPRSAAPGGCRAPAP